ncbi:MAG: hypothetical protein AAF393_06885 [Pseudomonadota bacterium]
MSDINAKLDEVSEAITELAAGETTVLAYLNKNRIVVTVLVVNALITAGLALVTLYMAYSANQIQRSHATAQFITAFAEPQVLDGIVALQTANRQVLRTNADYQELTRSTYHLRRTLEAFALCAKLGACNEDAAIAVICNPMRNLESELAKVAERSKQRGYQANSYHGYMPICLAYLKENT